MRQLQIILHMVNVVERYIYKMKGVQVNIRVNDILNNERQLNMLIDAFNHVKKEGHYGY